MICKACRAEIRWIKTTRLSSMPVDAEEISVSVLADPASLPEPHRRITVITREGTTETGYLCSAATAGARQVIGHVPHWATCPYATSFKNRQEGRS